ncbi:thermonuclease family protein [Methylophilus sp. 5]|uniref:thermonuclease family protein n=1 Tax=Methylophilus sp. 5 TaxID=1112274 RepID=UPI00048C6D33|nr:thermonuclease family protein [Methylophilus sp. 5]
MIKVWLPAGMLLLASVYAHAAPALVNVIDGDTVIIRDNNLTYHLRLLDIDAPERQQAFGIQSRRSLKQLCEHTSISVHLQGRDLYGRTLGHLYCNNTDASQSQIALGMAWFNARYSKRLELDALQRQAQQQRLGLWQDADPMPPWQWRKQYGQYYRRQR